jgi:hypothetical protein
MPKMATESSPVLALRKGIEQQVQHREHHLTRCRCMRAQVLEELDQELSARPLRSSDPPKRGV